MLRFIDTYTGSAAAEDLCIPRVAKQQHGPGSTAGSIPARLFTPRQFPPAGSTVAGGGSGGGSFAGCGPPAEGHRTPLVVFFHGGGFVAGSVDTHDPLCRRLAAAAGCIVLSVDYRLAPEHPFPAAPEDCYTALCWAAENAVSLGADPDLLTVAGDSAGGTLAAVGTLQARDRGGPGIRQQVLIYPSTNGCFLGMPSHADFREGYFLEIRQMEWFCDQYVPNPADRSRPYASPLQAGDFRRLPPALVITAAFDPLRDEGKTYAEKLRAAGVPVKYRCFPGVTHGFIGMPKICRAADEAVGLVAETIGGNN